MNHSRTPDNQLIRLNKRYLPAPRAGQQPQAHLSQSKGAGASPVLIEQGGLVETTTGAMTKEELITRAKHHIGVGETSRNTSFRAAAEDMARAHAQGAKQRDIAKGVGKSVAWVNRLLKWQESGYVGAPFADKVVQGVNENAAPLDSPRIEPGLVCSSLATPDNKEPVQPDALLPIKLESAVGEQPEDTPVITPATIAVHAEGANAEADTCATAAANPGEQDDTGSAEPTAAKPTRKKLSAERRAGLIERLELLTTKRPRLRATLALQIEQRRAEVGLTWDELLIPSDEDVS